MKANKFAKPHKGMYILARLGNDETSWRVKMLIDSGASMSLLDKRIFDHISSETRPKLHPSTLQVTLADGHVRDCYGTVEIPVKVCGSEITLEFLVGNFSDEAILGMTDLQKLGLTIDFTNLKVSKGEYCIPVHDMDNNQLSTRVTLQSSVTVQPKSEYQVMGQVRSRDTRGLPRGPVMLQPVRSVMQKYGILTAKSLHNTDQKQVPVLLFNSNEDSVVLDSDTTIGVLVPVEEIQHQVSDTLSTRVKANGCQAEPCDSMQDLPDHMIDLYERSCKHLEERDKVKLKVFLVQYSDIFSKSDFDIGLWDIIEHEIQTDGATPKKQYPRKLAPSQRLAADKIVDDLLQQGFIKPSKSPWASPIVMVKKKDNNYRMCIDYRALNKVSVKDAYPMPSASSCFQQLSGARWFCSTDLASGYWQVKMSEGSKDKTAFCTRKGLFEWDAMPFGLTSACATFQRLMETILCDLRFESLLIYRDDILIWGSTVEETLERLGKFLDKLQGANLKLKPCKCSLFQKSVAFLGHIVSDKGISCDPSKIEAVKSWTVPTSRKEVKSFLGLASYYRRHISDFSTIAKPLTELTSNHIDFQWTNNCQLAFEKLKEALISAPILGYPKDNGLYILDTDASDVGVGGVLSQIQNDQEVVISYGSRTLSPQEKNYFVTRKELLAVVHHIKMFKGYLLGKHFKVRTDHFSLKYLHRFKEPEGQLARWLDFLQAFDFEVVIRPGAKHSNADSLSRKTVRCGGKRCQCCTFEDLQYEPPVVLETKLEREVGTQTEDLEDDKQKITARGIKFKQIWSNAEFKSEQLNDPDTGPAYKQIQESNPKPTWSKLSPFSAETKALMNEWERLKMSDGLLYRQWETNDGTRCWLQLVVPRRYREPILRQLHDSATGGHLGFHRTFSRLQARYYWPKSRDYTKLWIQTCKPCQMRKGPRQTAKAGMQTYLVGMPFERIATDIMGPFTTTDRGNTWLMVIGDYFSKFAVSVPLLNMTAETVSQALVDNWICYFGVPSEIHTDKGSNFESLVFREMCKLLGIDKTRTTTMRPQSDGFVERLNRTIGDSLNCVIFENPFSWDQLVKSCTFAYNSSVQESTGQTPAKMVFGREYKLPIDLISPVENPNQTKETLSAEHVLNLQSSLQIAYHNARIKLGQSTMKQQRLYNNHLRENEYQEGSLVYYYHPIKGAKTSKESHYQMEGTLCNCVQTVQ